MGQHQKRAILVNVIDPLANRHEELEKLQEITRLIETYGGVVIIRILQKRGRPSAKTFLGEGKAEEVARIAQGTHADVVIVDDFLKPRQSNNLRAIVGNAQYDCEVWDRMETILKIFEKHAETEEAKLQIELARLKYEFPKLLGKGIELSQITGRQRSAGSGTRGPGEKLLESKRRHLRRSIETIEKKLRQARTIHSKQRHIRQRRGFKTVVLVGYTNSGKSTLLQSLTHKNVEIADKLFTTLDTRIGRLYMQGNPNPSQPILIADTIGFIRDLPPLLIESFLATLEEVHTADLLVHVIDLADPCMEQKIEIVEDILKKLHCDGKPRFYVFNKIDIVAAPPLRALMEKYALFRPLFISAKKKIGLDILRATIHTRLCRD